VNKKNDEMDQDCDPLSTFQPCASAGVNKSSISSAPSWMGYTSCCSDSGNTTKPNGEISLLNSGTTTMEQGSGNSSNKKTKKKHRRKVDRKRTPKDAILPQKQICSNDNIQKKHQTTQCTISTC